MSAFASITTIGVYQKTSKYRRFPKLEGFLPFILSIDPAGY